MSGPTGGIVLINFPQLLELGFGEVPQPRSKPEIRTPLAN